MSQNGHSGCSTVHSCSGDKYVPDIHENHISENLLENCPHMSVNSIKEKYSFDILEHVSQNENITACSIFQVMTPDIFDLKQVGIKKHVPQTKEFIIFEHRNTLSRKVVRLLSCTYKDCGKVFRKWHNFYDHLRIHTKERPYICSHPGCNLSFT